MISHGGIGMASRAETVDRHSCCCGLPLDVRIVGERGGRVPSQNGVTSRATHCSQPFFGGRSLRTSLPCAVRPARLWWEYSWLGSQPLASWRLTEEHSTSGLVILLAAVHRISACRSFSRDRSRPSKTSFTDGVTGTGTRCGCRTRPVSRVLRTFDV